jgi:translation initiation factor 2 beta subunit (eIF-2beta)/eIF-5
MEKCAICGGEQDTKLFEKYNICTECADLMEDLMSEYFLKIISHNAKNSKESYAKYLQEIKKHPSNYAKIKKDTDKHHKHMEGDIKKELMKEHSSSEERYLTRLLDNIHWLEQNQDFYHQYFEQYYLCPSCSESLFDNYTAQQTGNWLIIKCGKCSTAVKKYFSPTLHKLTHIQN